MRLRVEKDGALLDVLAKRFPDSSKTTFRKWLRNERVRLDGRLAHRTDLPVSAGQTVEITKDSSILMRPPAPILYQDRYLIAVEKPVGILSVSRDREGEDTFYKRLQEYVHKISNGRERIFIVHRLDRDTSGIMVFALSAGVQEMLQRNWSLTEKRYWALVEGSPPETSGTIRSWLRENSAHRVYGGAPGEGAKLAITHYKVQRANPRWTLLEVRIETGRKNQIRAQLSELGCPIVGDSKYGARTNPIRRIGLHAFLLIFNHPVTGARIRLRTAIPAAFRAGG